MNNFIDTNLLNIDPNFLIRIYFGKFDIYDDGVTIGSYYINKEKFIKIQNMIKNLVDKNYSLKYTEYTFKDMKLIVDNNKSCIVEKQIKSFNNNNICIHIIDKHLIDIKKFPIINEYYNFSKIEVYNYLVSKYLKVLFVKEDTNYYIKIELYNKNNKIINDLKNIINLITKEIS